nr:hypothetical protein [Bradyrhizobium sp. SEMIA]
MTFAQRGLTRRQFGAGLASLATVVATTARSEAALPDIDTHAHVFHRGLKLAPGRAMRRTTTRRCRCIWSSSIATA